MNYMTVENLSKSYGDKPLFQNLSFGIQEGDKIGLIGVNGTGKSTLLKVLAQEEQPDEGFITTMNGLRIGYLPQSPNFSAHRTVLQQVFYGHDKKLAVVSDYLEAVEALEQHPEDKARERLVIERSQQVDKENAWDLESRAKTILTKLGIRDFQKDITLLSGGQQKRVAIASALIMPADILFLDEPTNHIDNDTVDWLEEYLRTYHKTLVMVTHDRYFWIG